MLAEISELTVNPNLAKAIVKEKSLTIFFKKKKKKVKNKNPPPPQKKKRLTVK